MKNRFVFIFSSFFALNSIALMAKSTLPNEVWAFHYEAGGNAFGGENYYLCETGQYLYRSYAVLSNKKNTVYTGTYSYDALTDSIQFLTFSLKIDNSDKVLLIPPQTTAKPPKILRFTDIIKDFQGTYKDPHSITVYYKNTGIFRQSGSIDPLFHQSFSRYPMQQVDINAICESKSSTLKQIK